MSNILDAICHIVQNPISELKTFYKGRNRANSMGDALENYIKDSFANTLDMDGEQNRILEFSKHFSWLGSQNNPPDIMLKKGDAIEVKKTQTPESSIALNSSYPKAKLRTDDPMITKECRECEDWIEKYLIYCIGHTTDAHLKSLWMVYGDVYAANHTTYERIKNTISKGIRNISNVEFSETRELGRVNKVDPLGITNLRIRGMWQIENPRKVFRYLHSSSKADFELVCIIPSKKYLDFPNESRSKLSSLRHTDLRIKDVLVKDPNNPAKLLDCKLITFSI